MADAHDIHQSLETDEDMFLTQNRQFSWIADSNNGSYSGGSQIIIDASGLANSGKYMSFSQSYIEVPLVMTLNSTTGNINNLGGENAFACSLKSGFHQLVHSMNVEIGNNSVNATTTYTNMAINYELLTRMSLDDERNLGTTIGIAKDDVLGTRYINGPSNLGLGDTNNQISKPVLSLVDGYGASSYFQNEGRLKRQINNTGYDIAQETTQSLAQVIASGKNYSQRDGTLNGAGLANGSVVNYYIIATLPLNILCDLFRKLPLVKGAYVKIILNLNTGCSTNVTLNAAGTQFVSMTTSSQNNVVPYMLSSCGGTAGFLGTGFNTNGTAPCQACQLSIGVARNSFSGVTYNHPTLTSCRLYACLYDLSPSCEQMYLSKMPTKVVKYEDFMSFQTLNVGPGSSFSQILTNGISRVRKLVGVPIISASVNYSGPGTVMSPLASPFSSAPATTCANPITNFNVLLSGVQLYSQNYNYSSEHFFQELRKINSLNGGSTIGLSLVC